MPKILLVFPVSDAGGGEQVLLNLVRFRERADVEYHALVIADADGPLTARLAELDVPSTRIPRGRMRHPVALIRAIRAGRQEIWRSKADVLLSNSAQGYLYGRWASGGRVPGVLYVMSVPDEHRRESLDALTWQTPPDRILAASNLIRQRLERQVAARPITTVYHGVAEPSPSTPPQVAEMEARLAELGVPRDARIVLMPGRLQRWKGQTAFVEAFGPVARQFPEAHGVFLGSGMFGLEDGYRNELDAAIGDHGMAGRVHLAGHQPIDPWLARASCIVHASLSPDAFPNVCVEALAARRPLITNTECGVAEILTHGVDAWVVPPRDVGALSAAIRDVLADPSAAPRVAEAGYRRYLAHCTPSHMVRQIEQALCGL